MSAKDRHSSRILVADDRPDVAQRIGRLLADNGYSTIVIKSRIEAFTELDGFDVTILDIVWPLKARPEGTTDLFGFSALTYLRRQSPSTQVILMSASLFDLDDLATIRTADGYFKSTADAAVVLNSLWTVLSEPDRSVQAQALSGVRLAEATLLEGHDSPSVLGLDKPTYDQLLREVQQMRTELQAGTGSPGSKPWEKRVTTLSTLASGSKNLFDLLTSIAKLFQ